MSFKDKVEDKIEDKAKNTVKAKNIVKAKTESEETLWVVNTTAQPIIITFPLDKEEEESLKSKIDMDFKNNKVFNPNSYFQHETYKLKFIPTIPKEVSVKKLKGEPVFKKLFEKGALKEHVDAKTEVENRIPEALR